MSVELLNKIRDVRLPSPQKFVLWLLADHQNAKTGRCDPSISRLAQESGLCELTVKRAISALEKGGYVRTVRCHGRRNQYHVTSNTELLVSQSYRYHRVTEPVTQSYYSSNTELPEPEETRRKPEGKQLDLACLPVEGIRNLVSEVCR